MNYFLLLLVLVVGGAGYYEYTIDTQKIADDQTTISNVASKTTALQAQVDLLTSQNATLTTNLAAADTKLKGMTQAQAPTAPVAGAAISPTQAKANLAALGGGVVIIKGDNAEGTGFLVKTADGPAVVTNLHVLANNPNIKISTPNGTAITYTGMKGASDRDLAMLSIKDGPYTYLPLAVDVAKTAQITDHVTTPGNSQGGDVLLNTSGTVLALGPDRVEISNPIYHGNSGGPVFHDASGTVIGVVTEAMKVDMSNDLDKVSFANRSSAISSSMRYFGLRLDNVPKWEVYDPRQFQQQTTFLDEFEDQNERLDSYLNSSSSSPNGGSVANDHAKAYLADEKIMAAHNGFRSALSGTDAASQIDALRQLCFALDSIADKNVESIQNMNNFYSFEQQRAKDELDYRQALKKEIQDLSGNVTRIGSLPRSN